VFVIICIEYNGFHFNIIIYRKYTIKKVGRLHKGYGRLNCSRPERRTQIRVRSGVHWVLNPDWLDGGQNISRNNSIKYL